MPSLPRPALVPIGLIVLEAALVAGLGVALSASLSEQAAEAREEIALARAHARIVHLDELLTMSAHMAAQTGDASWGRRYWLHEPLLRRTIDETLARSQPDESGDVRALRHANDQLVAIESRVLELATSGRLEEARAEIGGGEYRRWKAQYSDGVQSLVRRIGERAREHARLRSRQSLFIVLALAIASALPGLGMVAFSLRAARASRRAAGAELATRSSRAREELVLDALDVGALEPAPSGLRLSSGARRLFGTTSEVASWPELSGTVGAPGAAAVRRALSVSGPGSEASEDLEVRGRWLRLRARCLEDGERVAVVHDVTESKARERELEARVAERTEALEAQAHRVRDLLAELASTEERERHRLAAIVHDDLQQALVAVRFQIAGLRARTEGPELGALERAVEQALSSLRSLVAELGPQLADETLLETLERVAVDAERLFGLEVDVAVEDGLDVGPMACAMLSRAARELLLNVHKHAGARRAEVRVELEGERLTLTVTDDGSGLAEDVVFGFGLRALARRAEALGGRLSIGPGPHGRVRVEVDRLRLPAS